MHIHDNMSLNNHKFCNSITYHISMFLPALITGNLIKKYGHSKIMYFGVLFLYLQLYLVTSIKQ